MAKVLDMNAPLDTKRIHEIIVRKVGDHVETKKYSLSSSEATVMPLDHAMMFLKDSAFVVSTMDGEIIQPVPVRDESLPATLKLQPGEVVATLYELSMEALFKRVKIVAGSQHIGADASREDMITFLMNSKAIKVGVARGSEGLAPEMSADELNLLDLG